MTCSSDVWPDISLKTTTYRSQVKQEPAWQEFEREGEENWDAPESAREKGGEDRRLY